MQNVYIWRESVLPLPTDSKICNSVTITNSQGMSTETNINDNIAQDLLLKTFRIISNAMPVLLLIPF